MDPTPPPEPDPPRSAFLQKSTTTGFPKKTVPARVFRQPYLRRASYDPSQLAELDVVQSGEQRRRSLSSLDSRDNPITKPGSTSRELVLAPARGPPDSPDRQQVNAPGTILPSSTTARLLSYPQERPTSRHGSSNTQLYYIPAGDARGLGIITETSESSASLAALSPRQAITNLPLSVGTQIRAPFKTHSTQDNAITPLSSPYIPIAEAVRKRAADGLAPKTTEPEVPDVFGTVASFAVATSSVASSPETSILCDGTLWYLYVRSGPPYRWVHCKAILTKTHLELSWNNRDGPSSVGLDLLRCLQVRAMPCASHPSARADIGSIAAYEEKNASLNLVEDLYPFHITYKEDVERLAADSVRERIRWVGFILDAITKLESNADCTQTPPMSPSPRLRALSIGSFRAPRSQIDGNLSAFGLSMSRFRRGLRHHSRTKSGGDLPTPAKEDPRAKLAPLRRTYSMLANPHPAHSVLNQPAPPASSMRKRKVSNPMSFVTGILGRITPSEGSSSRFFTRSRLLSRRGLDTPSPVLTPEPALVVGSTSKSGGRGSAREGIQNVKKRKKPPTVVDGPSQATTATDVPFTSSSFSYTSSGSQNATTSSVRLISDPPTLPTPPRVPRIGWRTEEAATGADSSASAYATANVISSSSSPHITAHNQPSRQFITPLGTPQTTTLHNTAPRDPPHSRITSASTMPTTNAQGRILHSRSSSNKDLPALPAPLLKRRDDAARPEPLLLTLEDIIALESPKSWRSLSPQEENPSSVPQPIRTPSKKAAITNQPRFPSTFRQLTPEEDWLAPEDSPLLNHSASLHEHKLSAIGSLTPGSARVTPEEPLGAPLLQDTSRCPTPIPAPALRARRTSGSTPSRGVLRPTLPLRLSSRRSSITLPTTPITSGGRHNPTRSISVTSLRSHRATWVDAPAIMTPRDKESPATIRGISIQLQRRDGEQVEETHALSEQLERIEQQLMRLSTFVQRRARSIGLRPSGEPVVSVANLDGLARSEPLVEEVINWPTPPTGGRIIESVDNMPTTLEAATEASEKGGSEELEDADLRAQLSATPLSLTPESWSHPTPPPNSPASIFTPTSAGRRSESSSIQPNPPPPSFLSVPDGSRSMSAQVTNAELFGSLNDLRRVMDRFIRWHQITNDSLEDLRGHITVQQMEGLGVNGLASYTQALNHISQSLGAIADQLHTGSSGGSTKLPAPLRSSIAFDAQKYAIVPQATPQIRSAPSSPLPLPPSIGLAHNPALTSLPSSSSAAYTHATNDTIQRPSIWQPRARRVVPRRRVFSEPASSAGQTASGLRNSIEQERVRAPNGSGTPSTAIRLPSILRSQSPDRTPLSGAQSKTSGKPNVSTEIRPTYQRSVSAPVAHEGAKVKSKSKRRNVAWASPLVSDLNPFETSRAKTDPDLQSSLGDAQVASALYPPVDFQEVLQLIKEVNLRQITASKQQSEVVRYLTELNEWLGRDQQDRQSEFLGIGGQIDMLRALINDFVHQTTSRGPHDAHVLTGAPQSHDVIHRDIIIPQSANSDVPRSVATVPRNVTGTTGFPPQFMPPASAPLPRGLMNSTSHNPIPSSIDILADSAELTSGSPASPSSPLLAQRQSESSPAEAPSLTLRIVNLTEQDTFGSTSSSSRPDDTLFQSLRTASAPFPVLVDPENTRDLPLSYGAPHATLASSLSSMVDHNDVSEFPRPHSPSSMLPQGPLTQPRPREIVIPPCSSPSKAAIQEASHSAGPAQTILHETSVHAFPEDRSPEQNTVDAPFPLQLTPVNFPEPRHFVIGSVPSPIPATISLSSDVNSYPHLTTPSSLKSRRAVSLPASPGHGSTHRGIAGRPTSQTVYSNQVNSFSIAPNEVPPDVLEPRSTVNAQSLQNPNYHSAWLYPLKTQVPSMHKSSVVPEPIMKRPLPRPVTFGESPLAPQTALRPEDSISMTGALQGSRGLQATPRVHQDTTAVPPSPVVMQGNHRLVQPRTAFVPAQNAPGPRSLHERTRVVPAPPQELPFPNLVRGTNVMTAQQRNNADTKPDIPVAPSTHDIVQDILASVHMSLTAQKQDRDSYIQQVAQITRRDGAWLEDERKRARELEEELRRLRADADGEHRGRMSDIETKCEEARLAAEANHTEIISHFKEFTTRIDESLQEEAAQRHKITEHLNLKEQKGGEKGAQFAVLESMLRKVVDDETAERLRAQKQREEEALRPGAEQVIEELWRHNMEHQRLMTDFMNASLTRNQQQHEETLDAVRRTASEQIPFNIQKYLEEFSNSLAAEVSTLLQEVGQLREDRRSLQHEIGYLMCLKSKYAPGGEFHAGWQPAIADVQCTHPTAEPEVIGLSNVTQDQPVNIPHHHPPALAPPPPPKLGTLQKREKGRGKSRVPAPRDNTQAPSVIPTQAHHTTPFTVSNNITPAAPSSRTPRLYGPRVPETGVTSFRHAP